MYNETETGDSVRRLDGNSDSESMLDGLDGSTF